MAVRITRSSRVVSFAAAAIAIALIFGAGGGGASAQRGKPRIWDIPFGAHVRDLPALEFVDPACGTNGGPAGLAIGTFDKFEKCPEGASGFREIWFIYDDTMEYVARAMREPRRRLRYSISP